MRPNVFKLSYSCLPPCDAFLKFLRFFVGNKTPIKQYGFIGSYFQTNFLHLRRWVLLAWPVQARLSDGSGRGIMFGCCCISFGFMYFLFEFWTLEPLIVLFCGHVPWISYELCMVWDWIMRWLFAQVCFISLLLLLLLHPRVVYNLRARITNCLHRCKP